MSLESLTVSQLRDIATRMSISGRSGLTRKRDLIRAIEAMDSSTRRKRVKRARQAVNKKRQEEEKECATGLRQLLEDVQVLPRESSSESLQLLAAVGDGVPVFVKVMFSPRSGREEWDGLRAERLVYEDVVGPLMDYSPHFVLPIGTYTCNNFQDYIVPGSALDVEYRRLVKDRTFRLLYNVKLPVHLMITEQAYPGETLQQFLGSRQLKWHEVKQLFFQLAYTLYLMERVGFAHNDLHTDNLFVYDLGTPQEIYYRLETGEVFRLHSRYQIALFDWDLSVVYPEASSRPRVPTVRNPHLTRRGTCWVGAADAFTPLLDWYRVNWYVFIDIVVHAEYEGNPWRTGYMRWITRFISGDLFLFDALHSRTRGGEADSSGAACFNNWDLDNAVFRSGRYMFRFEYAKRFREGFPAVAQEIAEDLGLTSDTRVDECGTPLCPAVARLAELGYIDPLSQVLEEGFRDLRYDGAIPKGKVGYFIPSQR